MAVCQIIARAKVHHSPPNPLIIVRLYSKYKIILKSLGGNQIICYFCTDNCIIALYPFRGFNGQADDVNRPLVFYSMQFVWSRLRLVNVFNLQSYCYRLGSREFSSTMKSRSFPITSISAGNHFTLSQSSFVSHFAASCSFRCSASVNSEQRKQCIVK